MSYSLGFLRRFVTGWTNLSLRMKGLLVLSLPIASFLVSAALIFELEREKIDTDQLAHLCLGTVVQTRRLESLEHLVRPFEVHPR